MYRLRIPMAVRAATVVAFGLCTVSAVSNIPSTTPALAADPCAAPLPALHSPPFLDRHQVVQVFDSTGYQLALTTTRLRDHLGGVTAHLPPGDKLVAWEIGFPLGEIYIGLAHTFMHGSTRHVCGSGTAYRGWSSGPPSFATVHLPFTLNGAVSATHARVDAQIGRGHVHFDAVPRPDR